MPPGPDSDIALAGGPDDTANNDGDDANDLQKKGGRSSSVCCVGVSNVLRKGNRSQQAASDLNSNEGEEGKQVERKPTIKAMQDA